MLPEQVDLVIFLDAEWEAAKHRNRQHFLIAELAQQLEGRSNVLAVERPMCPWTGPVRGPEKYVEWLRGRRGLRQVTANLYLYTPAVLLHNVIAAHIPGLAVLNRRLVQALVRRVLRRLEFRPDSLVAWVHHPYQLEDVGLVGERLLVYDCYDDYLSQARGRRLADLQRREAAILEKADVVLAASERLWEAFRGRARRVHLVPNGVDVTLSGGATCPETVVPPSIALFPHPIIGFVGKVGAWLDFKILARLATAHPEWNLAFVGVREDGRSLSRCPGYESFSRAPNVHFLGPRPHNEVPRYVKAFDVCIIPYLLEGQVPASSPLKLYEYLATGKPIVSVDVPHIACFQPLVRIARDAGEFEREVAEALRERDEGLRQQRVAAARENSWEKRAERVIALLEECL